MSFRRLSLALPLLAGIALPAAAQQSGLYDVTGTNLDGTSYTGVAQVQQVGLASFTILWRIGNQAVEGVGFASGRTIAVAYGLSRRPGIGIYTLNPDGSMEGEWTIIGAPANARERLVPRTPPESAAPAPASPVPGTPEPRGAAPAAPAGNPPANDPPGAAAPAPSPAPQ